MIISSWARTAGLHYSAEPRDSSLPPLGRCVLRQRGPNWPRPGVAVLLTGMFSDGAKGLLALRRLGWRTIAQDESSSVVWGMPKAAVEIGAAEEVLPLSEIAAAIVRLVPELIERHADDDVKFAQFFDTRFRYILTPRPAGSCPNEHRTRLDPAQGHGLADR